VKRWLPALLLALTLGPAAAQETSCTTCHKDADLFEGDAAKVVADFAGSVHAEVGLSCHDCHGGNPDLALADDIDAMDENFAGSPYVGAPQAIDVPAFCGRCHSDPVYMKRFRPDARADQEQIYATSHHGQALAAGDTKVANCVSCHRSHDIRRASDSESSVYPTKVAETCGACHSDAEHMKGYTTDDGRPLPTNQYGLWRHSVHAKTMFEREDLSAPTCNDCHGNHGAAPPGLESVAFVCGQCHGREAELFRKSPKHAGFTEHNEYLADAGAESCAACHEDPEPQAKLTTVHSFNECATCHGNHGVMRPTVALFSPLPETPCAFCHEPFGDSAATAIELDRTAARYAQVRDGLLRDAAAQGFEGDERFNWLVTKAENLVFHNLPATGDAEAPQHRPEFARLYDKFRIGRTFETYIDPATGDEISVRNIRCADCHAAEPLAADEPIGLTTAQGMLDRMRELTVTTASAERIILAARRGGVEVRDGLDAIDQAVDAQIRLAALVHGFSIADDSPFVASHDEGMAQARAALESGHQAVDELAFRRKGLVIALAIILVLLAALGLKIRQLGHSE
jgi:hypothetical protein